MAEKFWASGFVSSPMTPTMVRRLAAADVRREAQLLHPLDDVLDLFQAGVGTDDEDHFGSQVVRRSVSQ